MFKRLFKLFSIIILLLSGHFVHAKTNSLHCVKKNQLKHASFASAPAHDANREIKNNSGFPVQIVNLQRHKTVHFIQYMYTRHTESVAYIRYLIFTCGPYDSELSLFRKLILFPFHVFW